MFNFSLNTLVCFVMTIRYLRRARYIQRKSYAINVYEYVEFSYFACLHLYADLIRFVQVDVVS